MDDRKNTIAGWVLAAGIAALGLSIVTGEYFRAERPEKMGYTVEGVEEAGAGGGPAEAEKPIEFYLASADPTKGANVFKKCQACHTAEKGGPNGTGPDLYGVIGEPIGQGANGFPFTDALKSKGGTWDWDKLSQWLKSPKTYAPGTKMTFAGLSKPQDRADVIAYLNQHSDHPLPMPAVPAEAAAPAAGDEAGAGNAAANEAAPADNAAEAAPAPAK